MKRDSQSAFNWGQRLVAVVLFVLFAPAATAGEQSLDVTATAYNSVEAQTSQQPWVAAWGDRLAPGMQVIAVSRDLLRLGLRRGTVVHIEGLPGRFVVLDKMNKRWRRKIDVYMALDIEGAREFGRRDVTIRWGGDVPGEAARSFLLRTRMASAETARSTTLVAEAETP